jgi:hypothetical protein
MQLAHGELLAYLITIWFQAHASVECAHPRKVGTVLALPALVVLPATIWVRSTLQFDEVIVVVGLYSTCAACSGGEAHYHLFSEHVAIECGHRHIFSTAPELPALGGMPATMWSRSALQLKDVFVGNGCAQFWRYVLRL